MWIFLNNSYLSIVAHRDRPNDLLVRARKQGDIEGVFGRVEVAETPEADYRFRAVVTRERVSSVLAEKAREIDYPNFKDSVDDDARHDAYLGVWSVMRHYQDGG